LPRHHWLVLNIPGSDVTKGETRKGYVPSAPPKGSGMVRRASHTTAAVGRCSALALARAVVVGPLAGLHRYVYVLYEHDQPITAPNEPHLRSDQSVATAAPRLYRRRRS